VDDIRIISVDDHVIEPPDLFTDRLPSQDRDRAPHVVRLHGTYRATDPSQAVVESDDGYWMDCWMYEDLVSPIPTGFTAVSFEMEDLAEPRAVIYDEIRPGAWQQGARLADMDLNSTEASLCFPTFPRFCGQTFLNAKDRDLAFKCVRVYNDWMIDEWCGGDGYGRLIPLTLVPLWDPDLAADEVRRCAAKGSHAIAFSELPHLLGVPSIHTGRWDPLWAACQETDTVVNMHIGSSSSSHKSAPDAPFMSTIVLVHLGSVLALTDWLLSGVLERFADLRIAFSEGQVGWMPYQLERLDKIWESAGHYAGVGELLSRPPSAYLPDRVFGCIFDDTHGLISRDVIGMGQIMFEVDYPHRDSNWPNSMEVAGKIVQRAGLNERETHMLLRENAIRCYRLDRYGIRS
jgi:predicted TIM-barrel fold metal-dependent hydrolase